MFPISDKPGVIPWPPLTQKFGREEQVLFLELLRPTRTHQLGRK